MDRTVSARATGGFANPHLRVVGHRPVQLPRAVPAADVVASVRRGWVVAPDPRCHHGEVSGSDEALGAL